MLSVVALSPSVANLRLVDRRAGAAAFAAVSLFAWRAEASDPLNPSRHGARPQDTTRDTTDVVPIAGGSSDVGVVLGAVASFSRVPPNRGLYAWKVDASAVAAADRIDGKLDLPYQEAFVKITYTRLLGTRAMLTLRPSYMWEKRVYYYGIGNASVDAAPAGRTRRFYQYGRRHSEAYAELQWPVADHLAAKVGARFEQSAIQTERDTKLVEDASGANTDLRGLAAFQKDQWIGLFKVGLQWDDRDGEVSPHRGGWHQLEWRVSPGGSGAFPYAYGQADAITRVFVPIARGTTLAVRVVGDVLVGSPPFFELARFDDTYALGGALGVRGVPGARYYGKVKVLGNLELRVDVTTFRAFGKALTLGVIGFVDGGRVWTDFHARPELDGTGVGLKYGTGGGLRLLSAQRFVVRADVAWSPDARPVGGYFGAGQIF